MVLVGTREKSMGTIPVRPLILGFIQARDLSPGLQSALTGQLAAWAHLEGYLLGTTYREQPGNGAFESLLQATKRHRAIGVVVPTYAHLGPNPEARVSAIRDNSGAAVYAVSPTPDRSRCEPD